MDAMGAWRLACAGTHPLAVDERPCIDVVGDARTHHRIRPLDRDIRRSEIVQDAGGDIAEGRGENIGQLCAFRPDVKPGRRIFGMGYIIQHSSFLGFLEL